MHTIQEEEDHSQTEKASEQGENKGQDKVIENGDVSENKEKNGITSRKESNNNNNKENHEKSNRKISVETSNDKRASRKGSALHKNPDGQNANLPVKNSTVQFASDVMSNADVPTMNNTMYNTKYGKKKSKPVDVNPNPYLHIIDVDELYSVSSKVKLNSYPWLLKI